MCLKAILARRPGGTVRVFGGWAPNTQLAASGQRDNFTFIELL
jgi:hypothetical protein